jgi:uncharacterized membrane protein YjgN (DUF898 family)
MDGQDPPATPPSPPVAGGPPSGPAGTILGPVNPTSRAFRRPSFRGSGGTLFGIHVVNVLLTLVTVGIYYFWAKTRVRRYLAGQTEIEGDRFAYHGTPRELLLGMLKALLVFGLPILVLDLIRDVLDVPSHVKLIAGFLSAAMIFLFYPVAIVGSRRYRLSRISWRGIHFSFQGRMLELIMMVLHGGILTGLTLGLYYPVFAVRRQAFLVSNSYFGGERFAFTGRGRDLFWPFAIAVLLTIPTLGLCWIWYVARKRRYFWDHTRFGDARFSCSITSGALLRLWVVNAILLLCTLGLAWPWVRTRSINFSYRNLALLGPLDLDRIEQQALRASTVGEGLAGFFDTGFDF